MKRGLCRLLVSAGLAVSGLAVSCQNAGSDRLSGALESLLSGTFPADGPGGVVLVALHDRPLLRRAYGMADLELGVPMRPEHVLATGSITKQFTAAAVLQLVGQGRIGLDEDVRRHVPEFDARGRTVTIEQLLTHTSGLPNLVDRVDFEELARRDHDVGQLLALTDGMPWRFEPGTDFYYSDSGYILLGAVIERVSGMSYADYLEKNLFRPLGMKDTWYGDDARIIPGRAKGYSMRRGAAVNAAPISMTVPYAAGAVYSNVDDLLRWDRAVRSGEVVGEDLLRRAWSPVQLPDGTRSGYAFGWKVCSLDGHSTIEHGGFINGFGASAMRFPEDGLNVIVLVNNDADVPDAGALARRLARFVLTGSPEPRFVTLGEEQRAALLGRYRSASGEVREILERNGRLVELRSGAPRPLAALSATELTEAAGDGALVLRFEIGSDGRAVRLRSFLRCEPGAAAVRVGP